MRISLKEDEVWDIGVNLRHGSLFNLLELKEFQVAVSSSQAVTKFEMVRAATLVVAVQRASLLWAKLSRKLPDNRQHFSSNENS